MKVEEAKSQDHNLVNQIRVNGFHWRNHVPLAFEALAVIFALVFGYYYREFLHQNAWSPVVFTFFGLYMVFSGLLTFISHHFLRRLGLAALESLAFSAAFFFNRPISTLFLVWAIVFISLLWGISRAREDIATNVKIKFFHGFRLHINKLVTGLTLAVLILYLPQWNASNIFFSQGTVEKTFVPISGILSKLYPEIKISPTSTVEGVAESVALSKLEQNQIFKSLSESARRAAVQEAVSSVLSSLQQSFGEGVNKNDSLPTALYKAIISGLMGWKDKLGNGFILVWAIIVFFLIRSLGAVTSWISLILAYLLYQLLLIAKILRIGEEHRTIETLEFV